MKKVFFIALAISSATVVLNAQQTRFGLKAGITASSVKVEDGDDYESKAGIYLGGLAHIHITKQLAFQPELVYSMQGGKDGEFKLKLNYINIPLLVQYMTNDGFRFQTGPQLGFLALGKTKSGDVEVDIKDDLESMDLSWIFGAGYLFPGGIGVDLRYNHGITNIVEDNDFEARNRVFQVGLFYQFMKGRTGKKR